MVRQVCVTAQEEALFRGVWESVHFQQGQVVCDKGEVADQMFYIEVGWRK